VTDLLQLLQEFHGQKLAMMLRHQAGARLVGQYDANNAYQYIINREEVQLSWLEAAIAELAGRSALAESDALAGTAAAARESQGSVAGTGADAAMKTPKEDAVDAQAFVDRWRRRVEAMTNARHRGMLQVILGETLEHKRFFEQALAGRTDLLGRRAAQLGPARGRVLATRWVE
jgi:hypothetical protein